MMPLEACLQQFERDYERRIEKNTIVLYQRTVREMITYCSIPFQKITTRDIRKWIHHLDESGRAPATINKKLFALRLFYTYCLDEQIIAHNPTKAVRLLDIGDKMPHYLLPEQLLRLRKLAASNTRDRAIVEVLYTTGIRLSELVEIQLEDIDWSERLIYIQKGKRKKTRIVLFTRLCAEYLQAYLQERDSSCSYLFLNSRRTKPLGVRGIQHKFNDYSKELSIPFSVHTLRHTFAAHLAMRGMPLECIQMLLGHEDPHQTQLYARLYNQARKEQYDQWM